MSQHAPGREDATLFVENGTQQHVGADKTFDQNVGLAVSHHHDRLGRGFFIAGGSNGIGWKGRQMQRFRHLGNGIKMADEDDLNHHFFNGTDHGFER